MPRITLDPYAEHKEATRRAIRVGLARKGMEVAELEKNGVVKASTAYKRLRLPETMKLEELWRMDRTLHFTDNQILAIFGRCSKEEI